MKAARPARRGLQRVEEFEGQADAEQAGAQEGDKLQPRLVVSGVKVKTLSNSTFIQQAISKD